jgi:uncharacterized membrane protein
MGEVMSTDAGHRSPATAATSDPERMWLAHHDAAHAERCLHVGDVAVCRRCAVLYPVAVLTTVAVLVLDPPQTLLVLAMWLLPVPMVIDWTLEQLGRTRYSPVRQVVVTAVGAPALGAAVAIHAVAPFSLAAVAPVVVWGIACAATAWWAWWRDVPQEAPGWEARHQAEETARRAHLEQLLADVDGCDESPAP